ncbi:alpha/beta fold hydrolase [Noviherbaspirillum sp. Root189]|uniref:alpha/beta fold hydrolase n=1 Tax=Noviherbaspirillum sp. Root189 TaxID=1736487 RepID=UPI00070EE851|nr:alpha/beta hydrolase [Noviherbaspirillum sp. Root189]KRB86963.1 hydrolase [Noviherbaspirillum sp. Root189]
MTHPQPFVREGGAGSRVICIHANASTSAQWRGLIDLLLPKYHIVAPDSYGAGKSPDWHSDRIISLRDELALIEPLLTEAKDPVVLVGHSYGAAVALIAALVHPARVRALALYEPTLFSLVDAESPPPNDADGIRNAVQMASMALDRGDQEAAAEAFIDYWMGTGSWKNTPEPRKQSIAASVKNVRRWAHALMSEPTPLATFRQLDIPILYMVGGRSTASAHGVARVLLSTLPQAHLVRFNELGHMGPITNPEAVNAAIEQFLRQI